MIVQPGEFSSPSEWQTALPLETVCRFDQHPLQSRSCVASSSSFETEVVGGGLEGIVGARSSSDDVVSGQTVVRKSPLFRLAERRRRKALLYGRPSADDAAGCHTLTVL